MSLISRLFSKFANAFAPYPEISDAPIVAPMVAAYRAKTPTRLNRTKYGYDKLVRGDLNLVKIKGAFTPERAKAIQTTATIYGNRHGVKFHTATAPSGVKGKLSVYVSTSKLKRGSIDD